LRLHREVKTITHLAPFACADCDRIAVLAGCKESHGTFYLFGDRDYSIGGMDGRATEMLAARMGEEASGLLNATFGNAAELIIAVIALSKGLSSVVKASIAGSIIGNILLVLGLSILCRGTEYSE
jgi:calcium/proton exchanger cax